MTRGELQATLAVVVLVIVGVIALWPRSSGAGPTPGSPVVSAPSAPSAPVGPSSAPVGPSAAPVGPSAAARRAAALRPCPGPPPTPARPVARLAGPALDCLGSAGRVDLATALAGRATLVNLWASWCGPCREELPALAAYARTPGAVDVLGVDVADSPDAALGLLDELDVHYPSVSDPGRAVAARTAAPPILPVSVVVRPDATVVPVPPRILRDPGQVAAAVDAALAAPAVTR